MSRAVCPEGAVSNTTRSYSLAPCSTTSAMRSIRAASCIPGASLLSAMCLSTSPRRCTGISRCSELLISFICRRTVSSGSSSKPSRPGAKRTGFEPIVRSKRWPRLCAGSVDTSSTLPPACARAKADAADTVVLPTPPLPPKKRIFLLWVSSNSNVRGPKVSAPYPCGYAIRESARRR